MPIAGARRVNRTDVKLDEKSYGDDIVLAVDASDTRAQLKKKEWRSGVLLPNVLYRVVVG